MAIREKKRVMCWRIACAIMFVSLNIVIQGGQRGGAQTGRTQQERRRTAAQTATEVSKKNQPVEQLKEKFLTPIGAMYIYKQVAGLIEAMNDAFKGASDQLNSIAATLDSLGKQLDTMLDPVNKAPEKLREASQSIESKFIKQVNETLATVDTQRKQILALNLKGKGIADLRQLEELVLVSFGELEKFLRILLITLTEIKDAINQIIAPVSNGAKDVIANKNKLIAQIKSGEFGYPGLPARLRAIATILNP